MAQIKLTYFNLRARAEPARLVLAYAGAKYEDVRLPAPWDNPKPWADLKPDLQLLETLAHQRAPPSCLLEVAHQRTNLRVSSATDIY